MSAEKGDRIRILVDRASSARVEAGDVLLVLGPVDSVPGAFLTESPRNPAARGWWFSQGAEGELWELVTDGG